MQKQHSNAKISSPKFQQVCCWLALKIKPWCKKKKKIALHLHLIITINIEIEVGMSSISAKNPKLQVSVWIEMIVAFSVSRFPLFFFFYSYAWTVTSHGFTVHTLFITIHALKNIKNGSRGTIHTFKNYFTTVLSIFSFQFQQQ